jgi:hypothetical protein
MSHLIHENDRRCVLSCHYEKLSNHTRSLSNVLLNKLRSLQHERSDSAIHNQLWENFWPPHRDTNEAAVSVMSDRSRKQSFPRSRRSIKQHTFWLRDTQTFENFWMLDWKLDYLLDLLNLFAYSHLRNPNQ